jgi:hydroxypyruvate isomerase
LIFSPSIEAIYRKSEVPIEEQIRRVKDLGFEAFEFWGWWNKDLESIKCAAEQADIQMASFCSKFVSLVDPDQREKYLMGLKESVEAAKILNCRNLICLTGSLLEGVPRHDQMESLVEGLKASVPLLEGTGITLLLEPLNTLVDHKGYFLERSDEAFRVIEQVDSEHIKVLFDIYHQQITEGNLIPNIISNIDKIGYFHIADHPGRHDIGTGDINYRNVLEAISKTGYKGCIGLEYFPLGDADESLRRFRQEYASY